MFVGFANSINYDSGLKNIIALEFIDYLVLVKLFLPLFRFNDTMPCRYLSFHFFS